MSTERAVVILGAGGHARVLLGVLHTLGVPVRGYLAPTADGSRLGDTEWLGDDNALPGLEDVVLVNGIGSAGRLGRREKAHAAGVAAGLSFLTVVHPRAIIENGAILGEGAQVLAGAVVGAGASVGADAIINTAALLDHDSSIGMHSHLATGAAIAGDAVVGDSTHVGLGARVLQGVTIGSSCVIGAGAVVLTDVPDGSTAVGVPARILTEERNG